MFFFLLCCSRKEIAVINLKVACDLVERIALGTSIPKRGKHNVNQLNALYYKHSEPLKCIIHTL